jgi:phosphoribosylaminoimidazole carboxylase (NCAIR synthetase)
MCWKTMRTARLRISVIILPKAISQILKQYTSFGKSLDALTIEIESVNVDALEKLESEGVKIYPKPSAIRIIKNKVIQKEFYSRHQIPLLNL